MPLLVVASSIEPMHRPGNIDRTNLKSRGTFPVATSRRQSCRRDLFTMCSELDFEHVSGCILSVKVILALIVRVEPVVVVGSSASSQNEACLGIIHCSDTADSIAISEICRIVLSKPCKDGATLFGWCCIVPKGQLLPRSRPTS